MASLALRTLFVADAHLANHRFQGGAASSGLNQRAQLVLQAIGASVDLACAHNCSWWASLGDLTDGTRPEPQLLAAVQAAVLRDGLEVVFEKGNHEMVSDQPGDHSLGPLAALINGTVVDDAPLVLGKPGVIDFIYVPFRPGPAKAWLPDALLQLQGGGPGVGQNPPSAPARVLALHLGIMDDKTPAFIRNAPDAVEVQQLVDLCGAHGIGMVVAGNWHRRALWRGTRYIGAGDPG